MVNHQNPTKDRKKWQHHKRGECPELVEGQTLTRPSFHSGLAHGEPPTNKKDIQPTSAANAAPILSIYWNAPMGRCISDPPVMLKTE
jgi:hypothetical protein